MGWNTSGFIVENAAEDEILALLPDVFTPRDKHLSYEEAASRSLGPNFAIGKGTTQDGVKWVQFWDPSGYIAMNGALIAKLSTGRRAASYFMSGVKSTYGFSLFVDGEIQRRIVWADREVKEEHGEALDAEAQLPMPEWGHDEHSIFRLLLALGFRPVEEQTEFRYLELG